MLVALSIRDVVLISALDLSFHGGLTVFTGETGAGKSILLDSLSLVLGARADAGLVRHGATQLSVSAQFSPAKDHPLWAVLDEQGMTPGDDGLLIRRVVSADGRSRAWINDQPVSVGLLRQIGDGLVEIHGQFATHGLLDPTTHRAVLDDFADNAALRQRVKEAWEHWCLLAGQRAKAEADLKQARAEEEDLRHACAELDGLAPKEGEEDTLSARRALLQHAEKLLTAFQEANTALAPDGDGVEGALRTAGRILQRVADRAEGRLDEVLAALDRAADAVAEASMLLDRAGNDLDMDPAALEKTEERLFALRALARKHQVAVDELPALSQSLHDKLSLLDGSGTDLARLAQAEQTARAAYIRVAEELTTARKTAAQQLDAAIAAELPPLKLDKARFATQITPLAENQWGALGQDGIEFYVATNPGAPFGPLGKIASGGELSRFMLALKVVLARIGTVPTLVFDEVDSGIGGAVAAAVGERLARLAQQVQVLVVTHSPQVAARGGHHYRVVKTETTKDQVSTDVQTLNDTARREEIARMLAGETITDHARAAALSLLNGA